MTNEEAVKMLRTMQRTVYLGNRKFEDAIECAIKALSEPLQPWEVLVAQAVLPQPKMGKWIPVGMAEAVGGESAMWGSAIAYHVCSECMEQALEEDGEEKLSDFCPSCGAKMEVTT